MSSVIFLFYIVFSLIVLYKRVNALVWDVVSMLYLIFATLFIGFPAFLGIITWVFIVGIIAIHRVDELRDIIANFLYKIAKKSMPALSKTEEEALNIGDTWFEESIFCGEPDLKSLESINPVLSEEEHDFLHNEVDELCFMLDEWSIAANEDLPENAWKFIKEKGFLGIVLPKEYGGKGFSARAHSDIVMKIASRSCAAAVSIMVPNSLGPGELLLHYGTDEQKKYYLPRLASGLDIPCFALTEPEAGSDATSIKSRAIVVAKTIDGKKTLGLNINLDKRWITLAPIATLLGVAVDLQDPDGLLANVGQEGITCVLIPRDTANLKIGNRHLPAHLALMNGTIRGENIFVPITNIIGGQKQAGHGWEMLVKCLSIGRSISLPALSHAVTSVAYLTTGAYSSIRSQFRAPIGHFEGVKEKLAEIAGLNYLINATRFLTLAAIDSGKKPSVASGLTKYFTTEFARTVINNAMDVHGGRAIVLGPRNYLSNIYSSLPIFITVEGANIMTRNLLIFGQGAVAAHPFLQNEMLAIRDEDEETFKSLVWEHINYFTHNFAKAVCSAWSGGFFIKSAGGVLAREYQMLKRLSYSYAFLADLSLAYLGGSLKRKERLSARLADGMSYLYMASAALHYAKDVDNNTANILHAKWAARYCYYHAQRAMLDLCNNYPSKLFGKIISFLVNPYGQSMHLPDDKLDNDLSDMMLKQNDYRLHLLKSIYLSGDNNQPLDRVEYAYDLLSKNQDLYKKIKGLHKYRLDELDDLLAIKVDAGEITQEEASVLITIEKARWDAILVDEFSFESLKNQK